MRSYRESCGIAHAVDLIGERWAVLVVRELLLGPKRFTDLDADLPGVSASVLSDRLRQLESRRIVARTLGAPPGRARLYALTDWGAELAPILATLGDWALRSPSHDPSLPISDDAAALALATHFTKGERGWHAEYELRIGRGVFAARIVAGRLQLERGAARRPDAVLTAKARPFTRMLGPNPHRQVTAKEVSGDLHGVRKMLAAVHIAAH